MGTATDTLMVVRCRYCVVGDDFGPMVAHRDGRCICAKCGHLASLFDRDFKCSCWKCLDLRALNYRRCG